MIIPLIFFIYSTTSKNLKIRTLQQSVKCQAAQLTFKVVGTGISCYLYIIGDS